MPDGDSVERRSVSLYPQDWAEVDTLARTAGGSTSGALRRIIREWSNLRDPVIHTDELIEIAKAYVSGEITPEEFQVAIRLIVK